MCIYKCRLRGGKYSKLMVVPGFLYCIRVSHIKPQTSRTCKSGDFMVSFASMLDVDLEDSSDSPDMMDVYWRIPHRQD